MRRALLSAALALALIAPADALAGRWAVGVEPGAFARTAASLPGATTLVPGRALLVEGERPRVAGARYVLRLDRGRKLAFRNDEPLAGEQWYLPQVRAWTYWPQPPGLKTVKVAVIDSGIDAGHPEFAGRIVGGKSFVGGSWRRDTDGHGTFVAGVIAADPFNGRGIAGLGLNARLLVAKVVQPDGFVSLEGEIKAITWAVNRGAQVINLSLGGVRDPHDLRLDTYSPLERDAIGYAHARGVVVVAAVGNGPDSPMMPWRFADYPAALPHVIGVGALKQDGSVPAFSNRDALYVDIAAPGQGVFSTIPRNLVDRQSGCSGRPYSDCGPLEFRQAIGTSFAAPQVAAAAALLLGVDPTLSPDQVAWLLERSATDVGPAACSRCRPGRDSFSGWGKLDVERALRLLATSRDELPRPDAYEPNDGTGSLAHPFGKPRTITATLDYWDDPVDVYAIKLRKGERVSAQLAAAAGGMKLVLWTPGTVRIFGQPPNGARAALAAVAKERRLSYRAPKAGTYYLQVRLTEPLRTRPAYGLTVAIERPTPPRR